MENAFEISWFAPSCLGDTARLGVTDPSRLATFTYNRHVIVTADRLGFRNVLIPSSFVPGMDPWIVAAAIGPTLGSARLLPAVRVGEFDPPMFARAATSLQSAMNGRLTINIISSELAGETLDSASRYRRTAEAMDLLRRFWTSDHVLFDGEFWQYDLPTAATHTSTPPPMYFGGTSEHARDVAARFADCYLMWVETVDSIAELVADMSARAAAYGRTLSFGLRSHVIVRESEHIARAAASELISELDPVAGRRLRQASHDHQSVGVQRQDALRAAAGEDGFAEESLWTGIGVARSGVGAAVLGDPGQVEAKLRAYAEVGIDAFILSGYPLDDEAERFARLVLPRFRLTDLTF
ncbi:MAG: LLM class flavin-dependent oxidoreductase [Ilumatobacteraceae bacterium]